MTIANFIFVAFMVIISLLVLVTTKGFPTGDYTVGFGPGFFPGIIAYVIIGLSLLLIIQTLRSKEKRSINMELKLLKLPITLVGLIIIFSIVLKHIGFILSTLSILFVAMIVLKTKAIKSLIISVAITVLIYVGFKLVLKVPLPEGIFM